MSSYSTTIDCGNSLTVANVAVIHEKLQAALKESSTINLRAEEVEKVDTAGLQLFIALEKEVERVGGKIVWQDPSSDLIQASKTLGLTKSLKLNS